MCRQEELYWAEQVFPMLIRVADLRDPIQAALASTCVDDKSLAALENRAASGDQEAAIILDLVRLHPSPVPMEQPEIASGYSPPEEAAAIKEPSVMPEGLAEYLATLSPPYQQWQFLKAWFAKQVTQGNVEASFFALRDWMRKRDYYLVDGDLLIEMLPFAEEFGGGDEGFEFLCMAAIRSYAWSRWGMSQTVREKLWAELQKRYPDRWLEYIFRTCKTSTYGSPLRKMTPLPVSLGTEFLIQFDEIQSAETLVEADLMLIEGLMANLLIPRVNWFDESYNALDSIIARAFWLGPQVRRRASEQLAGLLLQTATEGATTKRLLEGLASEKLESRTLIWLLPIVKAARRGWNAPRQAIRKAVKTSSAASEALLAEL